MSERNHRTVYQLWAEGCSVNGWRFRAKSRAIFARREDAEAHITEFKMRCVDPEFNVAEHAHDNESLSIRVVEFDFYD